MGNTCESLCKKIKKEDNGTKADNKNNLSDKELEDKTGDKKNGINGIENKQKNKLNENNKEEEKLNVSNNKNNNTPSRVIVIIYFNLL